MPQDSQTIVDRMRAGLPSDKLQNQEISRERLDGSFRQCINYAVSEAFKHADRGEKDPAVITAQLIDNDLNHQAFYRNYQETISRLIARDEYQANELKQLETVENAQGMRNAKWRFISTLAVGTAILVLYAVAGWLDIALPLSGIK